MRVIFMIRALAAIADRIAQTWECRSAELCFDMGGTSSVYIDAKNSEAVGQFRVLEFSRQIAKFDGMTLKRRLWG